MLNINLPRYIGLCGNPNSGKSTAQEILWGVAECKPVDDGACLRNIGMAQFGLTHDQCYTQAGKLEMIDVAGRPRQVRDILGSLGKALEDQFGEHIMPYLATRGLGAEARYSFGSVRKTQGHFYRNAGGIIIEIVNPDAGPSPYAFDKYDAGAVNYRVVNDALARGASKAEAFNDLQVKIVNVLQLHANQGQGFAAE